LIGCPVAGIGLAGYPLERYLQFPPREDYVIHAPFSWPVFIGYAVFTITIVLPFFLRGIRQIGRTAYLRSDTFPFPWWGWLGVVTGVFAWILAWNRFSWFSTLQPHTFIPLWLSYIIVVNALNYRYRGRCMMLHRPWFFCILFPVSALFWWFFEYLNRFVQNWHYAGVEFGAWEYFWYATLSFSIVLPAVLGTRDLIFEARWLQAGFRDFVPLRSPRPKLTAWGALAVSGCALAGIGVWPNYLFPMLWVSPLLIIVSLQALAGDAHPFQGVRSGDWRLVVSSALAALVCGLFWETWNYYSLAKWEYTVPYVNRFSVFEMPLLGYAGYLPFGLECSAIENAERAHSP